MKNMPTNSYKFDWSDLAFGSKKPVNTLDGIFIVASRDISAARFKQLVKTYLPKANLIVGVAKESYVLGLEDQPQFKMLNSDDIQNIISQINNSKSLNKVYTLAYFQRELPYILSKLKLSKVILINGSWKYAFHNLEAYYILANQRINYEMISPFVDETEAMKSEHVTDKEIEKLNMFSSGKFDEIEMINRVDMASRYSYDYNFQTGAVLGKRINKKDDEFEYLGFSFNKVIPYQTYAMHHGALREVNFAPPNDLNYYDTVHAEVLMMLKSIKEKIDITGTTLFINLLPCPTCARMLCETDVAEIVYRLDHSDGYGFNILKKAGKVVRRFEG